MGDQSGYLFSGRPFGGTVMMIKLCATKLLLKVFKNNILIYVKKLS